MVARLRRNEKMRETFGRYIDPRVVETLVDRPALAATDGQRRVMTVLLHFAAAWLSGRIGLVNTMVFTHIPSSVLLVTLPIAPNFEVAAVLFVLREGLAEMDVPTRQSYLMAIVPAHERSWASGMSQLARADLSS